jgi:hypothetical protein
LIINDDLQPIESHEEEIFFTSIELDSIMRCIWCQKKAYTRDHVFPRSLGGTLELAVPACKKCQRTISVAELEISRRSVFSIYRWNRGPNRRNPKRPDSGSVEPVYLMVKDDSGRYIEVALRRGEMPITLPSIQIDVVSGQACTRGTSPEVIDNLLQKFWDLMNQPPDKTGFVCEIDAPLFVEKEIASDPDWWPRIFLNLRDQLVIRARDPEEAKKFIHILVVTSKNGAYSAHTNWETKLIEAGKPHHIRLEYDINLIHRVISKIAVAGLYASIGDIQVESEQIDLLKKYILGESDETYEPSLQELFAPDVIKVWPEQHVLFIEPADGRLVAYLVLYGAFYALDLGINPAPEMMNKTIVAKSFQNGCRTYFATSEEIVADGEQFYSLLKSLS